jgi:chaperonin GroEL
MSKHFSSKDTLREKITEGVNILADNVASTLGPRGRNVILQQKNAMPIITKDGVTVAKFVDLKDPVMNAGAQLVKQASAKTNVDAGDGTTTSTVLTRAIYNEALKHIEDGISPVEIKRGIDKTVKEVCNRIEDAARPVSSAEDVAHVASISANNDEGIGDIIAMAVDKVGKDGSITIEEARSVDTTLELVEGFRFDSGYAAAAFVTDQRRNVARHDRPLFLITDNKLERVEQILPALEIAARESRPFVIVADDIEGQALAALIMNTVRGSMKVVAIKAPRYGEERRNIMNDLAIATGSRFFKRELGDDVKEVKLNDFGSAKSIEISKNSTTIVGGDADPVLLDDRIGTLKNEIEITESLRECEIIQERITRLASGVAIIKVGAATQVEMLEKKHRIEDALEAVRSAQMEGIVPGGGTILFRISQDLSLPPDTLENKEQELGLLIIKEALASPIRMMSRNSGYDFEEIVAKLSSTSDLKSGINFNSGELVDLFELGIIDPAKVTRCALQNAASVAGILITTDHAIIEAD